MTAQEAELASVSQWIASLKTDGNEQAAQKLYERYLTRLTYLARGKLGRFSRRLADEEDVAHSALASFFHQIQRGSFPQLEDRQDLWQILLMLTDRRVADLKRRHFCRKRGAGREMSESGMGDRGHDRRYRVIEQVIDQEPTPDFAVEFVDLCEQLLAQLDDPLFRQIAAMKLEGRTNDEIARELGCVRRTVQRKLNLIRTIWQSGTAATLLGEEP